MADVFEPILPSALVNQKSRMVEFFNRESLPSRALLRSSFCRLFDERDSDTTSFRGKRSHVGISDGWLL